MEWMLDPTACTGLIALSFLQLILGVDNLVFIAILAQRLPEEQRDRAARYGLMLALLLRVIMLLAVSWMASLTTPLFEFLGREVSGRDLLMMGGGLFLLWKATIEIHSRLEGRHTEGVKHEFQARYWMVVMQIFLLDSVFSVDAIITALGMTPYVPVMVISMTIAILIMLWLARPLTDFMQKHPTMVMLCLGFLLMVGLSLVADGCGFEIPKGYLYGAIGFSLLVETINQFAQVKLKKRVRTVVNVREKAADAILKLMGAKPIEGGVEEVQEANVLLQQAAKTGVLSAYEKEMLRGVLNLSTRQVHSIMTSRHEIEYVDIKAPPQEIYETVNKSERSRLVAVDKKIDNVVGVLRKGKFLSAWLEGGSRHSVDKLLDEPLFVQETDSVMELLELLKKFPAALVVVTDAKGAVEGVVTHIDMLEAIAGEFPSQDEPYAPFSIRDGAEGEITMDGTASIYDVCNRLGVDYKPDGNFSTVAGLVLFGLGKIPEKGDTLDWMGWRLEVRKMDGRRIARIKASRIESDAAR